MQQPHDDFWPQTLPGQVREIWRRSGLAAHVRLISAVIGWAFLVVLLSVVAMVFYQRNAQQWLSMATSELLWIIGFLSELRVELIWLGSIHLALWSQWRWPTRPSIRKFVLLAVGLTVFSALLRYPPVGSSFRVDRWMSLWGNHVVVLAWYVLLIRSISTFTHFQLVTPDAVWSDTQAGRSWSLRGFFLATLLVAITIAMKRWASSLYDEFSQPFSRGVMTWFEIISLSYALVSTLSFVFAAAAIRVGRGFVLSGVFVALSAVLVMLGSAVNLLLLPAAVTQVNWSPILTDWVFRAVVVVSLHLAAFRVWRWAGYSLRISDRTSPVAADPATAPSGGGGD